MKVLKQFFKWLKKALAHVLIYNGWPFIVAILIHWIVLNIFPQGFMLGFYIGAAIALSWNEIRKGIVKLWKNEDV